MADLESLSDVGIFTRDWAKAKQFYVKKIGLKVRSEDKKFGYIALGATLNGKDASLNLWQPSPEWGLEQYEIGLRQVGTVTGIGFRTSDLGRTAAALKKRGVKVEISDEQDEGKFGRFTDPDKNELFLEEPAKPKVRKAGVSKLDFVTVVSRDAKRAGQFFTKALGMGARRVPGQEQFVTYRLSPKGTAIMPFTPTREMYKDPSDYDADMGHLGEPTSIGFSTGKIQGLQEKLMGRGVRFTQKTKLEPYGMVARFLDLDDNEYTIIQPIER